MGIAVDIGEPVWGEGDPEQSVRTLIHNCEATDTDHEPYCGQFDYVVWLYGDAVAKTELVAVKISVALDHIVAADRRSIVSLNATLIRDLPLARWDTACRNEIVKRHDAIARGLAKILEEASPDAQRALLVNASLRLRYPDLEKDQSPSGKRRARSLRKLAEVATDYTLLRAEGRADPAAELARRHDVHPNTARTWIHRARQADLIPPATADWPESASLVDRALHIREALRVASGKEALRVASGKPTTGTERSETQA